MSRLLIGDNVDDDSDMPSPDKIPLLLKMRIKIFYAWYRINNAIQNIKK